MALQMEQSAMFLEPIEAVLAKYSGAFGAFASRF